MVLVIDTFKLVKGAGKSIGIYNLTKSLVSYLGAENVRRGMPHKIVVLGNPKNQKDMERDGTEFVIVPGNPLDRKTFVITRTGFCSREDTGRLSTTAKIRLLCMI